MRRLFHAPERRASVFFNGGDMSSTFHMANAEFLHLRAANVPSELWTVDDMHTTSNPSTVNRSAITLCVCTAAQIQDDSPIRDTSREFGRLF